MEAILARCTIFSLWSGIKLRKTISFCLKQGSVTDTAIPTLLTLHLTRTFQIQEDSSRYGKIHCSMSLLWSAPATTSLSRPEWVVQGQERGIGYWGHSNCQYHALLKPWHTPLPNLVSTPFLPQPSNSCPPSIPHANLVVLGLPRGLSSHWCSHLPHAEMARLCYMGHGLLHQLQSTLHHWKASSGEASSQ